ncbi:MAG: beta-glucosidase [Ruminiclostridium sp.]|nr:beta-glucosidase [Ruminiclostridium sp.]
MNDKSRPKYLEPGQPIEIRVEDLIGRMTLEEKMRQMGMHSITQLLKDGKFSHKLAQEFFKDMGIGAMQVPHLNPEDSAEAINELQKFLKDDTRLGIPALVISECLHGFMSPGATIFPQAIGLASTWDIDLFRDIAAAAAKEARSVGVSQVLAPDLDLAREPRWGRTEETYGEDPYLCARMGVEYIKGIQGEGPAVDGEHVIATVKHFAAHGSPEGGVNLSPVPAGERQLRELYLPPFKAAVMEAGALSVMPAYSEFDGIPCSSSKMLLTKILRDEWGFKGYVFSDFTAINMLVDMHHTAETLEEAGKQALNAGMDMEAPSIQAFGEGLMKLVQKGEVAEELIDRAVSRILRVKFLAGLFENPYVSVERAAEVINCDNHRKLALKAAHESIILLKNKDGLLPLDRDIESIAVIGPNADIAQLGDYSIEKEGTVTLLQGIRNKVSPKTKVSYAKGCGIYELSKAGFSEAVEAARSSRVAVVAVGCASMIKCGIGWCDSNDNAATCGEGYDRTDLELPGIQQELVEELVKTGTPTIVVLVNGRPLSILWISENAHAILEAWYPGEEGGNALADIIFGDVNPSGKLPVSFPKTVGQIPIYYNYKPSARGFYHEPGSLEKPGRDYVFMDTNPLYAFGYGLSYTEFEYSDLDVTPNKISPYDKTTVSVNVKNVGNREGREVIQLYINDEVSSVTTPVKTLRGFKKVNLKPGEKQRISFTLTPDDLSLLDEYMRTVVEPGVFEVMAGGLKKKFKVK